MTFLIPLGLLGLLSIVAWFIIYIIKPNYQQKVISSSYIWKLSLKLKKKRVPMSKLRNILLILCQIAILISCALLLAQPAKIIRTQVTQREIIAIIDCSASMRTKNEEESRFNRAVSDVIDLTDDVFAENGYVSIILADSTSSFIAQRATTDSKRQIKAELQALIDNDSCSYGTADIDEAMSLCENVLVENPDASIYLYTDTTYSYVPNGITLVNVAETGEWNAGILDARAVLEEGYYTLYVDVACYGLDSEIPLTVEVYNANIANSDDTGIDRIVLSTTVKCNSDSTQTVIFRNGNIKEEDYESKAENIVLCAIGDSEKFYSYKDIHISIQANDSFADDDNFDIYNGQKHLLKVQYSSSDAGSFFPGILETLKSYYKDDLNVWDVSVDEVKDTEAATEGYDFYIFEHAMPSTMPTDGVVLLIDPNVLPTSLGITLGGTKDYNGERISLTKESDNALLNYLSVGNMELSRYTQILNYDPAAFELLISCDTNPVLLFKDDGDSKVIVAPFSLQYANVSIRKEFPLLLYNIFDYFFQPAVGANSYEVYESVTLHCMGQSMTVTGKDEPFTEFPATLKLDLPGTYTLTQTTDFGRTLIDRIYVKIPAAESNIWQSEDAFRNPYLYDNTIEYYQELMVYFAAVLVTLLFIEWFLQARDNL
jgi:hypothetical protein